MTLQDIYNQLAYGELRLLNLGSGDIDSDQTFPQESFIKMLPSVQLGLTELHKKFALREGRITLPLVEGQVTYVLTKKLDAPSDFQDNLLKVERIKGIYREEKYEIPLNVIDNPAAIRTTSYNTLLIPNDVKLAPWLKETNELEIVYRADHPRINVNIAQAAPLAVEVDLPSTYLQALLYFIASRSYNPVGMSQEFHEGNNYAMKYEQELMNLQALNFEIDDDAVNTRVVDNGWV